MCGERGSYFRWRYWTFGRRAGSLGHLVWAQSCTPGAFGRSMSPPAGLEIRPEFQAIGVARAIKLGADKGSSTASGRSGSERTQSSSRRCRQLFFLGPACSIISPV